MYTFVFENASEFVRFKTIGSAHERWFERGLGDVVSIPVVLGEDPVTPKHEREDGVDLDVFLSDETDLPVAKGKNVVEIE